MIWTARLLALSFLAVLCAPGLFSQSANASLSSPELLNSFIGSFKDHAGRTGTFPPSTIDDKTTIGDAIKYSVEKMVSIGKSSVSNLQALSMAFASSMVEIAVADGGHNTEEIAAAISESLSLAFLQTTGAVNPQFVNEISNLMNLSKLLEKCKA
ncbi:major ampullate spidroin 1A variant 3 [Trichonephila inaurata madagascariensis]|uniref:Major ampullate spidroin 1A variant 3 n=1 Tax=Trichonephila inaurata madagascariensis TaxID=2747483 RepID=A0A8X6JFH2_9ARAC|nr:major ampullate spidroin 1A variant 3 [Trichonephila inaurata madagascariensis]